MDQADEAVTEAAPKRGRKKNTNEDKPGDKPKGPTQPKKKPTGLPDKLRIELDAAGMNPSFRTGAGGLAAALWFISKERGLKPPWDEPLPLGPGAATVGSRHIEIEFGEDPDATLEALFQATFRLSAEGLIELAGTFEPQNPPDLWLAAQLQNALSMTILQHGAHRKMDKAGAQVRVRTLDTGQEATTSFVRCNSYVHQGAADEVLSALKQPVRLPGWAYSGAVERHVAMSGTSQWEFTADQALCGIFTAVGGLALNAHGRRGVMLLPQPKNLPAFARHRSRMTPAKDTDVLIASASDGALRLRLQLRLDKEASAIHAVEGIYANITTTLPWAKQQKSRCDTLELQSVPEASLDLYDTLIRLLPVRSLVSKKPNKVTGKPDAFTVASPIRAFVSDNLALNRPWFRGFATATSGTTSDPKPLFASLYKPEKEALMALIQHLEDAEAALVRAVHIALRQRFGAISEESGNTPAFKNRLQGERDKWRLAFSGAKTHSQIRAALADLWSRAGSNKELQAHWPLILPLLRETQWQTARDLSLLALASYRGKGPEAELDAEPELELTAEDTL